MNSLIVIPARLASSRLPEKLLLSETGKPVIQYTFEAAQRSQRAAEVVVATDSPRIVDVVTGFGGAATLTDPQAASGTDRVAEIAATRDDCEIFVNVQGDEPEIEGAQIDEVIALLEDDTDAQVATLATAMNDETAIADPACVKVVFSHQGYALYFSRLGIPFVRDGQATDAQHYQHVGIYAYRRQFLLNLASFRPSPLEQAEKLEQLRWLQQGVTIRVGVTRHAAQGIDTSDDYRAFVQRQQDGRAG